MSYLIDTHVLLWWLADDPQLGDSARERIRTGAVWVSAAAVWEIVIKKRIGKLEAPDDIDHQIHEQDFYVLDIKLPHVLALRSLPDHHSDPFDRIQIAQAATENLAFITKDKRIHRYKGIDIRTA